MKTRYGLLVCAALLVVAATDSAWSQYHPHLQRPVNPDGSCPLGYTKVVIKNIYGGAQTVCQTP